MVTKALCASACVFVPVTYCRVFDSTFLENKALSLTKMVVTCFMLLYLIELESGFVIFQNVEEKRMRENKNPPGNRERMSRSLVAAIVCVYNLARSLDKMRRCSRIIYVY